MDPLEHPRQGFTLSLAFLAVLLSLDPLALVGRRVVIFAHAALPVLYLALLYLLTQHILGVKDVAPLAELEDLTGGDLLEVSFVGPKSRVLHRVHFVHLLHVNFFLPQLLQLLE